MIRTNFCESRDKGLITNVKKQLVSDTPIKLSLNGEMKVSLVGPSESDTKSRNMYKFISIRPILEFRQRITSRRVLTSMLMSTNNNIEIPNEGPHNRMLRMKIAGTFPKLSPFNEVGGCIHSSTS